MRLRSGSLTALLTAGPAALAGVTAVALAITPAAASPAAIGLPAKTS